MTFCPPRFFVGLLLLCSPSWALAQSMVFDEPSVDLGKVQAVDIIEHHFHFKANGPTGVIVEDLRASCGCMRPKLDKKKYAPGEKGTITLGIHPLSKSAGKHRLELTLTVRDPNRRTISLMVNLDLVSPIKVEPSNILVVSKGTRTISRRITVIDSRDKPFMVTKLAPTHHSISARVLPTRDAHRTEIELEIMPPGDVGAREEGLTVLTNDDQFPKFEIPIVIRHPFSVQVFPNRLGIARGTLTVGARQRMLFLRDTSGREIEIESVTSDYKGVRFLWPKHATDRPKVMAQFGMLGPDGMPPGTYNIRVKLLKPEPHELTVPLRLE